MSVSSIRIDRVPPCAASLVLLCALSACETSNAVVPFATSEAGVAGTLTVPVAIAGAGPGPTIEAAGGPAVVNPPIAGAPEPSAAGSGGSGAGGSPAADRPVAGDTTVVAGSAAPPDCRPARHVRASLLTVKVSWEESLGLVGGSGTVYLWHRIQVDMQSATSGVTETRSCGAQLPIVTTTPIAGSLKTLLEIPLDAYESPSMPRFAGTIRKEGSTLTLDPGMFLQGLTLADPEGPWPTVEQTAKILAVDCDGDGKPGMTAVPRAGPGFTTPPTSVLQTEFMDRIYGVQRMRFTATATEVGCADVVMGTANVQYYDNRIIGCHIAGGGDCAAAEVMFINQARPPQRFEMKASWQSKVLPATASCAEVHAAFQVAAP